MFNYILFLHLTSVGSLPVLPCLPPMSVTTLRFLPFLVFVSVLVGMPFLMSVPYVRGSSAAHPIAGEMQLYWFLPGSNGFLVYEISDAHRREALGIPRHASSDLVRRAFLQVAFDFFRHKITLSQFSQAARTYKLYLSNKNYQILYDRGGFEALLVNRDAITGDPKVVPPSESFNINFGDNEVGSTGDFVYQNVTPDITFPAKIPLSMLLTTSNQTVSYERLRICPLCGGSGASDSNHLVQCITCHGQKFLNMTGAIKYRQSSRVKSVKVTQSSIQLCPHCGGFGKIPTQLCSLCGGRHTIAEKTQSILTIPEGAPPDHIVIISGGANEDGLRPPGNLIIKVISDVADRRRVYRGVDSLISGLDSDEEWEIYRVDDISNASDAANDTNEFSHSENMEHSEGSNRNKTAEDQLIKKKFLYEINDLKYIECVRNTTVISNIRCGLNITFSEALVGFTRWLTTIDDSVIHLSRENVTIDGDEVVVQGQGLPVFASHARNHNHSPRGHMFITINVLMPKTTKKRAQQKSDERGNGPRPQSVDSMASLILQRHYEKRHQRLCETAITKYFDNGHHQCRSSQQVHWFRYPPSTGLCA